MFAKVDKFQFLKYFDGNYSRISTEFFDFINKYNISLENCSVVDHYGQWWSRDNGLMPEQVGYDLRDGSHAALSLYKKDFDIKTLDVCSNFPFTFSALKGVPNLHYAGFFIMGPGAHLQPHTHTRKHFIYHLLLNDLSNSGCEFYCGKEKKKLKTPGDSLVFDYSIMHSTKNFSSQVRVNFVIDFEY